jgi:IMP dehydrogenase
MAVNFETAMDKKIVATALTYDDVLLMPQYSPVMSRKDVSTRTHVSRNIAINVPVVASNMDTVTEAKMAIAMARSGGLGILHRFCSVDEHCQMVQRVKRAQSLVVDEPRTISPDATAAQAEEGLMWDGRHGGVRSLMVVESSQKLLGIITRGDLEYSQPTDLVKNIMTPVSRLVTTTNPQMKVDEARDLLHRHRINDLPVVNDQGVLLGLITATDIRKLITNPNATLDSKGRLRVGAAVGVKRGDLARAVALVTAGVDVLVVDIAHGHSRVCVDMVKQLKTHPVTRGIDVIAGNVATGAGARALIEAGADGIKAGVGPGSICVTRLVAGAGVPQLSALMDIYRVTRALGVPIIADGGIKTAGDISKAIAAGASCVMLGNMLAGTDESPGNVLVKDGRKVKIIRGMAGYGANAAKAVREKQAEEDVYAALVPEGVEGSVPYRGPVAPILKQLVGGLRSGMSYCGATTIPMMHEVARFVRMTGSGLKESGAHDISKL